jgi:hypothetical protein
MSILSLALVFAIVSIPVIIILRNIQRRQELRWEQERVRGPHSSPAYKETDKKPLFETAQKLRFAIYGLIAVYLFFLILNIQRQAPLSDWSWAFLLALGLPAAGFVLYRVGVVEDAWGDLHIPSWPIVARKALLIFVALVILVVVLSHVIPKGFHAWPSLERNADQTGIKEFFLENWNDPTVLIGTLAFLAIVIFGSIKRVKLTEYVWGDNTPVFPRQSAPGATTAVVPAATTAATLTPSRSAGARNPGLFFIAIILIPVGIILLYAWAQSEHGLGIQDYISNKIRPGGDWSPGIPEHQPSVVPAPGQPTPQQQRSEVVPDKNKLQPVQIYLPPLQPCENWGDRYACKDKPAAPYTRKLVINPGTRGMFTLPERTKSRLHFHAYGGQHIFIEDCDHKPVDVNVDVNADATGFRLGCLTGDWIFSLTGGILYISSDPR